MICFILCVLSIDGLGSKIKARPIREKTDRLRLEKMIEIYRLTAKKDQS